ncbi:MFS toxin efflux pump [Penicillium samsonianum]|uniref:MFS toxin efflux pump n=1 Tax=Penicillium samsonianum TaxID=1882272 RepID=UPI0025477827|nr:MFS toxin efflux pump [Penicillium samsonianum]KAJ6138909.1 MFS toxin efflux pump [Penicillium samsonianum]
MFGKLYTEFKVKGVFTDRTTWRWCFWINLPIGAVTAVIVLFCIKHQTSTSAAEKQKIAGFLAKLDLLGTGLFIPFMVSLLLALQWGGATYPWSNWRVILCLCLSGILLPAWLLLQYSQGDKGTLPLRIACQRSVSGGTLFMFGINGAVFVFEYYVSIWFQAVKNQTAQQSGINFLASSGAMTIGAVLSGIAASKIGYYVPQMILCTTIVSVAAGLIFRYTLDTSTEYWVGTLVLIGFRTGIGMQMPLTAVQTIMKGTDVAAATSVLVLAQTLSGAIFLAVGHNLFQNRLIEVLNSSTNKVDSDLIIPNGASGLKTVVTKRYGSVAATKVLEVYNEALKECFLVCVVLSAVTIIGVMAMEWKSVKKGSEDEKTEFSASDKSDSG